MNSDNAVTWKQRARKQIAHGALTNSKRPESFVEGVYPTHLTHGKDCFVWDTDGKRYIDFICALGTNIMGYARREVVDATQNALLRGNLLSLGTNTEVMFAEAVQNFFPFVEQLRVLKSGSEGCSAAVRIARAKTGREFIVSEGYHGWHDEFVSLTPPALGVPKGNKESIVLLAIGEAMPAFLDPNFRPAAFIVEPVISDFSEKRINWLKNLRDLCSRYGTVLIFDETITALRFPGLSVAKHTGIYPDLIVFGKALANGLPISVVGGRREIMSADYFVSSTFAGDTLPMQAALTMMPYMRDNIGRIWEDAERFQKTFNDAGKDLVWIEGYPTRGIFKAKDELTLALFFQEACKAGILFGPSFFWCEPHREQSDFVLNVCGQIFSRLRNQEIKLEGRLPVKPYAQKVRENE